QRKLELSPQLWFPMKVQQEGEISRTYIEVPQLPIDKIRYSLTGSWKQKVPRMNIAMHNRQGSAFKEPQPWLKRRVEYSFQHQSIRDGKILLQIINQTWNVSGDVFNHRAEIRFGV